MSVPSKMALAVSGCFLHQFLMAKDCATAPAMIRALMLWALKNDVGLIPWTCPETMHSGLPRKSMGIERYRKAGLAATAQEIAGTFSEYLERQKLGGVNILAIVGVSFSPACSASRQAYHKNEQGLFIKALVDALAVRKIHIPVIDIDRRRSDNEIAIQLDELLPNARLL